MSITATLTQLGAVLGGLSIQPTRIYITPKEFVNVADFPAAVIEVPDNTQGTLITNNRGWSSNRYSVRVLLFLGALTLTPYDELNTRAFAWIDRLRGAITPDNMKISGSALTGKDDTDQIEIAYTKGQIPWGDNTQGYYGLMCTLIFYERFTDND